MSEPMLPAASRPRARVVMVTCAVAATALVGAAAIAAAASAGGATPSVYSATTCTTTTATSSPTSSPTTTTTSPTSSPTSPTISPTVTTTSPTTSPTVTTTSPGGILPTISLPGLPPLEKRAPAAREVEATACPTVIPTTSSKTGTPENPKLKLVSKTAGHFTVTLTTKPKIAKDKIALYVLEGRKYVKFCPNTSGHFKCTGAVTNSKGVFTRTFSADEGKTYYIVGQTAAKGKYEFGESKLTKVKIKK